MRHKLTANIKNTWTDGPKYIIAQPDSDPEIRDVADVVGTSVEIVQFIAQYSAPVGSFFVDLDLSTVLYLRKIKPNLDVRQLYVECS